MLKVKTDQNKTYWCRAAFTVETALLMSLILPMLILILLAGFFIHDRAYLQGIACEGAALAGAMEQEKDGIDAAQKTISARTGAALTWTRGTRASVTTDKALMRTNIEGIAEGTFPWLAAGPFGTGYTAALSEHWEKTVYEPADLIRAVRGAQAFLQNVFA